MNTADIYRYSSRVDVEKRIQAMQERIVAERREQIGITAACREAWEALHDFHKAEYNRIEDEVTARWGIDA